MSNAARIAEISAQIDQLEETRSELVAERKRLIAEDLAYDVPEFDSWDEVEWPEVKDTGVPFGAGQVQATIHRFPHIKVAGVEYFKYKRPAGVYDWVAIGELGVLDTGADQWIRPVHPNRIQWDQADDAGKAEMLRRFREYGKIMPEGKPVTLRQGLEPCPKRYLDAYLETHPKPEGPNKRVPQPITGP